MKKLFGPALLALAFLVPDLAQAANRFAICATTCTWDNTSTAMWSTTSGGATGASAPTSADAVIINAATCTGGTTCTITTFSGTISAQTITWGACTASTTGCIVDASVNNTNFTLNSSGADTFSGTGTGTRKWVGGTGTYSLTHTGSNSCFNMSTTTNDQGSTFSGATWSCLGTTTNVRTWNGGGFSFGPTSFGANTSGGTLGIAGANTFSTLAIAAPNYITLNTTGQTVSGAISFTGTSSSSLIVLSSQSLDLARTISIGSASTASWVAVRSITTSGAAALTATNCFDLLRNTFANGGSCTAPVTGSGGGRIIGG